MAAPDRLAGGYIRIDLSEIPFSIDTIDYGGWSTGMFTATDYGVVMTNATQTGSASWPVWSLYLTGTADTNSSFSIAVVYTPAAGTNDFNDAYLYFRHAPDYNLDAEMIYVDISAEFEVENYIEDAMHETGRDAEMGFYVSGSDDLNGEFVFYIYDGGTDPEPEPEPSSCFWKDLVLATQTCGGGSE